MANITAPSVSIAFLEKAASVINRGDRGIVAMLIKDPSASNVADYTIYDVTDIPSALTTANKEAIELVLKGYMTSPKKIIAHCVTGGVDDGYAEGLAYLGTQKWSWLVCPSVETDAETATVSSWIASQRTAGMSYKAVLPNTAADNPGIVNVTSTATYDGNTINAEVVACRVAGIIAGTPLTMSCTYAPIYDFTDCSRLSQADLDTAVTAGKLVLMWDGEKVKICRGVTSFTTTSATQGDSFKKIKLVEAMDMIRDDLLMTIQDSYIGRYVNSYDNKCLLISAINSYFAQLASEGVLASGYCEIDVDAQRTYFEGQGGTLVVDGEEIELEDATDQEVKEGNTGSYVYLRATVSMLDAIEDVVLDIYIG
jgi:hypothetical protein